MAAPAGKPRNATPAILSDRGGTRAAYMPALAITSADRRPGRIVTHNGKQVERWANQTDSGQNRVTPSADRWLERSSTYPGIARAFAQWADPDMVQLMEAAE